MKSHSLRRQLGTATLLVAALVLPETLEAQPSGQDTKKAGEHFDRGVTLYGEADHQGALIEFRRAYEIAPNYKILYNLGQAAFELKDYASAQSAFDRYLAEGGSKIDAARKKKVGTYLDELKKRIAFVTLSVSPEGAVIFVDDVKIGSSPLSEPMVLNVGRRKIVATKQGFVETTKIVDLAGGDRSSVEIVLAPESKPSEAPPPPVAPPPAPPPKTIREASPLPWIALGLTGALGVSAGITGGLALAAQSSYDDEVAKFPGDGDAIDDAAGKARRLSIATDVLLGATGAGAVVTLVLFLTLPISSEEVARSPVRFDVGPTGATLFGQF